MKRLMIVLCQTWRENGYFDSNFGFIVILYMCHLPFFIRQRTFKHNHGLIGFYTYNGLVENLSKVELFQSNPTRAMYTLTQGTKKETHYCLFWLLEVNKKGRRHFYVIVVVDCLSFGFKSIVVDCHNL